MLIKRPDDIPSSEITPESMYLNRRTFVGAAGALALGSVLAPNLLSA
jgi:sulfoxide reductase catalytic subunit YedY